VEGAGPRPPSELFADPGDANRWCGRVGSSGRAGCHTVHGHDLVPLASKAVEVGLACGVHFDDAIRAVNVDAKAALPPHQLVEEPHRRTRPGRRRADPPREFVFPLQVLQVLRSKCSENSNESSEAILKVAAL